nr:hypothetical protein [Eubacterium sp.]
MRHIFIINPEAGKKDQSERIRREILAACDEYDIQPLIFVSEYAGYEREMANKMCSLFSNEDIRLYCCGGSGTLSQIVSGIDNFQHVEVAHYPCGKNNDFIKCYGTRQFKKFASIKNLICGQSEPLDLMAVGGSYLLNFAGFGTQNMFFKATEEYEIEIDGRNYSGDYAFLACFNGSHIFGKYEPFPESKPNDGVMNIILAKEMSLIGQLRFYQKFIRNHLERLDSEFYILEAKKLSITQKDRKAPITFYGDSDWITSENMTTTIELKRRCLNFVVPDGVPSL